MVTNNNNEINRACAARSYVEYANLFAGRPAFAADRAAAGAALRGRPGWLGGDALIIEFLRARPRVATARPQNDAAAPARKTEQTEPRDDDDERRRSLPVDSGEARRRRRPVVARASRRRASFLCERSPPVVPATLLRWQSLVLSVARSARSAHV